MKKLIDIINEDFKLKKKGKIAHHLIHNVQELYDYIVHKYDLKHIDDVTDVSTCPKVLDLTDVEVDFPDDFQLAADKHGDIVGLFQNFMCEEIDISTWEIKDLNDRAFAYCEKLKIVYLPETLKTINLGMFFRCETIENVELPSTLKGVIGMWSFVGVNIKSIEIPEGVTSIDERAFWHSNIKTITLPKSLKNIEPEALDFNTLTSKQKIEVKTPKGNKKRLAKLLNDSGYNKLIKYIVEI